MVDTKTQYHRIKEEIDTAVLGVMESAQYIGGPVVNQFAEQLASYHGCRFAIPCGNGTDALQIAMMALGLKPGDEIIAASFTYIATVEAAAVLGIKPVFVEVDPQTFCIDPAAIEKAITPKTRAIVPVHLYGHAAPMEAIMEIANRHGLLVIEDNAQAIGCEYTFSDGRVQKTGTIGHVGCTSFYPSKNLGAFGDGGAIFTNDAALADQLKKIAIHGQSVRYYHDVVGCNSRLDAIQAAILSIKLKYLDEYIDRRQQAAAYYRKAFEGIAPITVPHVAPYSQHVYHQFTLVLNVEQDAAAYRDGMSRFLAEHSVPSMIYYPVPCHKQQMFSAMGGGSYHLPVTDWLTDRVISLPMHTELEEEQLDFIVSTVKKYIHP